MRAAFARWSILRAHRRRRHREESVGLDHGSLRDASIDSESAHHASRDLHFTHGRVDTSDRRLQPTCFAFKDGHPCLVFLPTWSWRVRRLPPVSHEVHASRPAEVSPCAGEASSTPFSRSPNRPSDSCRRRGLFTTRAAAVFPMRVVTPHIASTTERAFPHQRSFEPPPSQSPVGALSGDHGVGIRFPFRRPFRRALHVPSRNTPPDGSCRTHDPRARSRAPDPRP